MYSVDKEEKVKSSLYYPKIIHKALKRLFKEDIQDRKFNQIVIDIIAEHPIVRDMIEKIKIEEDEKNKLI